MARSGEDDEATRILCGAASGCMNRAPRRRPRRSSRWTAGIARWPTPPRAAADRSPRPGRSPATCSPARARSSCCTATCTMRTCSTAGPRGWLAIDPKGLIGERGFEYANLFRNPDAEVALSAGPPRAPGGDRRRDGGSGAGAAARLGPCLCGARRRLEPRRAAMTATPPSASRSPRSPGPNWRLGPREAVERRHDRLGHSGRRHLVTGRPRRRTSSLLGQARCNAQAAVDRRADIQPAADDRAGNARNSGRIAQQLTILEPASVH